MAFLRYLKVPRLATGAFCVVLHIRFDLSQHGRAQKLQKRNVLAIGPARYTSGGSSATRTKQGLDHQPGDPQLTGYASEKLADNVAQQANARWRRATLKPPRRHWGVESIEAAHASPLRHTLGTL
jgi:hypothetical protein